jgi:hypothetical protein
MAQVIQSLALGAAGCVLAVGLWQGWGTVAVLKRAALAYLAFFILGAALLLLVRSGALHPKRPGGQDG